MSFSRYATEDSVVSSEAVVTSMWANNVNPLTTFFTSSTYTEYNVNVYQTGSALTGSEIQFSLQYAHISGSGSAAINAVASTTNSPSRIIYGEYRNLIFGTETTNFTFNSGTGTTSEDFYVINFSRSRYKESIYPGSLNLRLSGSANLSLTDDSSITSTTNFMGENRYYNIVDTGSMTGTKYGYLFPDLDIILLDCSLLDTAVTSTPTRTSNTTTNNALILFGAIKLGASFQLQSQETISSRYFFTRVKNSEFNYTTNPSIIDDNGSIIYSTLVNNPQTYITSVGLYNDNNELLAVAKLSRPLLKDFTKEQLLRIKLSY
jgi:hypothetical protein